MKCKLCDWQHGCKSEVDQFAVSWQEVNAGLLKLDNRIVNNLRQRAALRAELEQPLRETRPGPSARHRTDIADFTST